ncbi:MAG: hypothetical protein HKN73_03355, partial [Gemmatimonadetes bacterium]|nr:hypothetical protein [Gemmatimonadota bacterium]
MWILHGVRALPGFCARWVRSVRAPSLVAVLALATNGGLAAQVALVLSGGGARGVAHAGVVSALDSLGVRPEIVVGTSMGAVVGALYAAGLEGSQ